MDPETTPEDKQTTPPTVEDTAATTEETAVAETETVEATEEVAETTPEMDSEPTAEPDEPTPEPVSTSEPEATSTETKAVIEEAVEPKTTEDPETPPEPTVQYVDKDVKLAKEKKSKLGLIIGIIVGVVVLLAAGIATWFFAYYNNPDKVVTDAIKHLSEAKHLVVTGQGGIVVGEDEASPVKMISIDTKTAINPSPSLSNSLKVSVVFNSEGRREGRSTSAVSLNNIVMADGVIYLQVEDLMDALEDILTADELEEAEAFLEIIDLVDNEWWEIDLAEILDTIGLDDAITDAITGVYDCVMGIHKDGKMSAELGKLYLEHKFFEVKPVAAVDPWNTASVTVASGHQAYEVTLDKAALAKFVNAIPETAAGKEAISCINDAAKDLGAGITVDDIEEIDASDVEWPDNLRVTLEVSRFGHKLRSVSTHYPLDEKSGTVVDFSLLFEEGENTISAPKEYRPVTDLVEEVMMRLFYGMTTIEFEDGDYYYL